MGRMVVIERRERELAETLAIMLAAAAGERS